MMSEVREVMHDQAAGSEPVSGLLDMSRWASEVRADQASGSGPISPLPLTSSEARVVSAE